MIWVEGLPFGVAPLLICPYPSESAWRLATLFVCSECSGPIGGRADVVTCSKACRDKRYRRIRDARIRAEAVAEYRERHGL